MSPNVEHRKKTVMLGTAMPAPADAGLNQDDKG
jgi:hypothetical protein